MVTFVKTRLWSRHPRTDDTSLQISLYRVLLFVPPAKCLSFVCVSGSLLPHTTHKLLLVPSQGLPTSHLSPLVPSTVKALHGPLPQTFSGHPTPIVKATMGLTLLLQWPYKTSSLTVLNCIQNFLFIENILNKKFSLFNCIFTYYLNQKLDLYGKIFNRTRALKFSR